MLNNIFWAFFAFVLVLFLVLLAAVLSYYTFIIALSVFRFVQMIKEKRTK